MNPSVTSVSSCKNLPVLAASTKSIAILGAGITGLTAAYRLTQRGHRVRVFEASDRVGGAMRSEVTADGWLIESGPNTLLAGDPALAALIGELGLTPDLLRAAPAAKHRYIVRQGRAVALPLSPLALLGSRLLSVAAKARVFREMRLRPRTRGQDVSLAALIREHFGDEIVDYVLNPFVTGIFAGDPEKLSSRHAFPKLWAAEQEHGSLLRAQVAARKTRPAEAGIISFRRGLQMLPDALAARLPAGTVSLRREVAALALDPAWTVICRDGSAERFDAVLAALPAPALAQLAFDSHATPPLAALDTIAHPPVAALFLGYRREQVAHALDGFGLLVPAVEQRSILGVLFSSTLFPGRAPAGHVALTVLVGGTRQPDIARLGAGRLLSRVEPDLEKLLGVQGAPVFQRHAFWPCAIPQYDLGHERHLAVIAELERAQPGFFVGGPVRDGIALPACITAGERLAARAEDGRSP
ncbi:MAG: protoporphyrinogen oxidase [Opitutaceae bacterium]|nr:protoporphyrinogen oxidase [Opitutaceae bacterium]